MSTPSLSPDGLALRFLVDRAIFVASRPRLDAPFGPATPDMSLLAGLGPVESYYVRDDDLERFIARDVAGMASDLFVQRRSSVRDPWSPLEPLASINTAASEWDPFLSPDRLTLWLQRQSASEITVFRMRRPRDGAAFGALEPIDLSSAGDDPGTPTLVADGSAVVFSADDRIWYAPVNGADTVGSPLELIGAEPGVNQFEPFIRPDGCEVFWVRGFPHTLVHARREP